jgi:type III secretion protein R
VAQALLGEGPAMNCLPVLLAGAVPSQATSAHPTTVLVVLAGLWILPFVFLLMSSFVKIAIVLGILKSALGSPQIPPSQIVTGLAIVLTLLAMAPTGERMLKAIEPEIAHGIAGEEILSASSLMQLGRAAEKAREPLREFLVRHGSARDKGAFLSLARHMHRDTADGEIGEKDFLVIVPAFLASELRRAFEIGLLLFLPFLVIDLVISNLLVALGLSALSPTAVSLPFKLLLFVLADGWQLLMHGLVASYA